jgi:hypothetical protein
MEIEKEVEIECTCPKCGFMFIHLELVTIEVEPIQDESRD